MPNHGVSGSKQSNPNGSVAEAQIRVPGPLPLNRGHVGRNSLGYVKFWTAGVSEGLWGHVGDFLEIVGVAILVKHF